VKPYKYGTTLKAREVVTKVVIEMGALITECVQNSLYHRAPFAALTPPEVLHPPAA